jgi:UDP-GlcNAc:undecaprenyl-phosphate/decaprenyl-phosphate GlcNAc-1-phosphate transferase
VVAVASIPSIIAVANRLSVFDEPNERKLHEESIPILGGVGIFAATLFAFTIWGSSFFETQHVFIITALIIIFFFGLRDDIAPLGALKKLSGQVIASLIVILYCDIRLQGLRGLFGIHNIGWLPSISITLLIMLFIINAYNFIDGIDGLAGGLAMIASVVFGTLFFVYSDFLMSILAFSLAGSLAGFLPYNFNKARIFMGDTGTMTVGFILAVLGLHFLELTRITNPPGFFTFESSPVMVFSAMVIPLTDTIRIFIVRLINRRSPFRADRNHIHHLLQILGFSTVATCIILYFVNIFFVVLAWMSRSWNPLFAFYILFGFASVLSVIPQLLLLMRKKRIEKVAISK